MLWDYSRAVLVLEMFFVGRGISIGFSEVRKETNSDDGDFAALKYSCPEILQKDINGNIWHTKEVYKSQFKT